MLQSRSCVLGVCFAGLFVALALVKVNGAHAPGHGRKNQAYSPGVRPPAGQGFAQQAVPPARLEPPATAASPQPMNAADPPSTGRTEPPQHTRQPAAASPRTYPSKGSPSPREKRAKREIWLFFGLALLLSWLIWTPLIVFNISTLSWLGGGIFLLGGFMPSILGAIFIVRREGWKSFWDRLLKPRRGWWLPIVGALVIYPLIFALSGGVASIALGAALPGFELWGTMTSGVLPFLGNLGYIFLLGPLAEEIGWRGYAQDRLQQWFSPVVSTLIVGLVWWAWHLPLFLMPSTLHGTEGFLSFFSMGYFMTVIGYSFLFAWLYNKSERSTLVPVLAHFAVNFTIAVAAPFSGTVFVLATVLVMILGLVLYLSDNQLGYRAKKNA